jgi:hypothetical protein
MNKIVIIVIVSLLLLSSGLYFLSDQKVSKVIETPKAEVSKQVVSSPTPKPVTNDDSFSSIETDLNNTVILEENFSDL